MTRTQRGFTMIEILVVVAIIGILANIAVPLFMKTIKRARAASVVGDFLLIRQAVFEYHRDTGLYPPDYYPGGEPRQLKPYLEGRVRWNRTDLGVKYDWDNWVRADGRPKHRHTGVLYGISVTTDNVGLVETIPEIYNGDFKYTLGKNYTFVLSPIP